MKHITDFVERSLIIRYVLIVLLGMASAFVYQLFIIPNHFAPTGINGLVTMIQYLFGINIGYLSLLINVPLLFVAFFKKSKEFALRTFVYIVVFALGNILYPLIDLSALQFVAEDSGTKLMAAAIAGTINGAGFSILIRIGSSSGGTDIIAAIINTKHPEYEFVWVLFFLNILVGFISFFVYGRSYEPVVLCVVYALINSRIADLILKGTKSAAKFEIVTSHAAEISREVIRDLKHGCTLIHAKGMYSGEERDMLICVVNRRQIVDFERIVSKYDHTFVIVSSAAGTLGNFKHIK